MLTKVFNLRTGQEWHYSLAPERAVVAAHEQADRHNFNTWTYDWSQARIGGGTVVCGDWAARLAPARSRGS